MDRLYIKFRFYRDDYNRPIKLSRIDLGIRSLINITVR